MAVDERPPESYVRALIPRGFTLEAKLGAGAFGTVWRATQDRFGRSVAVKCFDSATMNSAENRKRFEREAPLLARIRHPSIPFVLTAGEFSVGGRDVPFHVMELVEGPTLDRRLEDNQGPLSVVEGCAIAVSALRALHAAHEAKIIHRDVKPDNILLSPIGTYLIDFSLGVSLVYEPGLTRATVGGRGLGTYEYASPEQRQDALNVDLRTDIFSAGVMLMRMLSGVASPAAEIIERNLADTPVQLRQHIIRACSAKRENRFGTAADFANAIAPFADIAALAASTPTVAFCRNTKCNRATLSDSGYYRGPFIDSRSVVPYCTGCGGALVRDCPGCRRPLPRDLGELVVTGSRKGPDRLGANCAYCAARIFTVPTCKKCASLLKIADMDRDTALGCQKCKTRGRSYGGGYGSGGYGGGGYGTVPPVDPAPATPDDDIPF
ncbi:MAG: serine/threonine-protein kinase [Myxococcota bacterium]